MRYGKVITIISDGRTKETVEEKFINFITVRKQVQYTEVIQVKDHKDVLAEFLKSLDEQKSGSKHCIGLQTIEDEDGTIVRIEKSWIIPDLH